MSGEVKFRSPITSAPGPAKVHLKVKASWDIKTIYNVVFRIPGAVYPDEWIVRGNHHDAWVNGATDPVSGMGSLLEEARAFGELLKQGWKPKRTIIYCAWDAEEQGLIGSTEWAEAHRDELLRKGVAYINSDSNRRGYLRASAQARTRSRNSSTKSPATSWTRKLSFPSGSGSSCG